MVYIFANINGNIKIFVLGISAFTSIFNFMAFMTYVDEKRS